MAVGLNFTCIYRIQYSAFTLSAIYIDIKMHELKKGDVTMFSMGTEESMHV